MRRISSAFLLLALFFAACAQAVLAQGVRLLAPGESVERVIVCVEPHSYEFSLKAGEFFQVRVEQIGVDIRLEIVGEKGVSLASMDSPAGAEGPEVLSLVTGRDESLILKIDCSEQESTGGRYSLVREESRLTTQDDRLRVENERLFVDAISALSKDPGGPTAVEKFERTLAGWKNLNDEHFVNLTKELLKLAKLNVADRIFNEAFELYNQNTANGYRAAQKQFQAASDAYRELQDITEKAGLSIFLSGKCSENLGDNLAALRYFADALVFFKTHGFQKWEAAVLNDIGTVYDSIGEKREAIEYFEMSLVPRRAINDEKGEANTLNNLAAVYDSIGDKKLALEKYARASELFKANNDPIGFATVNLGIGLLYNSIGEKQKALSYYEAALPVFVEKNDKNGEASVLNNIGSVKNSLGEKKAALTLYARALALRKSMDDPKGQGTVLNNIGLVFDSLGEKQKALENYQKALEFRKAAGDKGGEATTLINIGLIYDSLLKKMLAVEYYAKALPLYRAILDKNGEASTLSNIGLVLYSVDEKKEALVYFRKSLEIRRATGDKVGEGIALTNIGTINNDLGQTKEALESLNEALVLFTAVGEQSQKANTLTLLSSYWQDRKNYGFASFYGKQAIQTYQLLRNDIRGMDTATQKNYLRTFDDSFRSVADILLDANRPAEAKQIIDLAKNQQFFDDNLISSGLKSEIFKTPAELDAEKNLGNAINKLVEVINRFTDLKRSNDPAVKTPVILQKLEDQAIAAENRFFNEVKQTAETFLSSSAETAAAENVPGARELPETLRSLEEQTGQKAVVIYTLLGESSFRAIIVSRDGLKSVTSPVNDAELNDKALKLWSLLQSPKYDTTVLSKQIYDAVFAPVERELPPGTTTIMWSLDGNLRYLPMAALWDGQRFLAERFRHVNFTRSDYALLTKPVSAKWQGSGFGTSAAQTVEVLGNRISFNKLDGVTTELEELFGKSDTSAGLMPGDTVLNASFDRQGFLRALKNRRPLVHIASHFSFQPGDEARSFLLLGDGTPFTLEEMKREKDLFQGVDLLTLSACNTAATQPDANGREIDGFAELAQRLGAGAVMATLWPVSDAATPFFMSDFYKTRETGLTKAEALRRAQLALLNGSGTIATTIKSRVVAQTRDVLRSSDPNPSVRVEIGADEPRPFIRDPKKPFAHPFYWAPFVLFGNWK